MDIIFVIGVGQAAFFALLLSRKKGKSVADRILMVWLLFIALHLLWYYWDYTGLTSRFPHLFGPNRFMPAAEGPFLWIYAQALLSGNQKFNYRWLFHFAPFFLLNLLVIDIYLLPAPEKLEFMKVVLPNALPWQAQIGNFFNLFSGPVYVILLLLQLRKFKNQMEGYFSTRQIDFLWLKRLAWGLGGIWIVVLGTAAFCYVTGTTLPDRNNTYIFTAVSFFVLFLGYHGLRHENILVKYPIAPNHGGTEGKSLEKYARSGLKAGQEKVLLDRIKLMMATEKLYLEPNLTLDDLAAKLSTPRHYISQAIGSESNLTFFALVNRYRVEEARRKLVSDNYGHFSVLGIGLDCGFNSKASFNRVFKELTGQTPTEYREKLKMMTS